MNVSWLPKNTTGEKIFGLDAFRGLAAFLVFLFHYWTFYLFGEKVEFLGLNVTAPFAAGHLGVDMFFVLSGCLIFLSLVRSHSLLSYAQKRFWRIFPLAAVFIVVVFLIKTDFSLMAWYDFFAHIFFLQTLFSETYHGLHPVMWTLSVEAIFYVILPLLLFLGRKKLWHFWSILGLLTILNFCYRFFLTQFFPEWTISERIFYSEQLWGRFDQFVLGIGLGNIWLFRDKFQKFIQKYYSIIIALGVCGFFFTFELFAEFGSSFREVVWMQMFLHFLVAFFFAVFLLGFLFAPRKIQRIFAPQSLIAFGIISYSVYLCHFPITSVVYQFVSQPMVGFFLTLLLTIVCSIWSFYFLEKPFLQRKKQ